MEKHCIICGQTESNRFTAGLKKCVKCDLVFADVDVTDEGIKNAYNRDYFFGNCYIDYIKEEKALKLNFRNRLLKLLQYVPSPEQKSLMEVGSAYGFFLDVAKKRFKSVQGIDITEEGCAYAKEKLGLNVLCDDFLKFEAGKDKYDVFCLWDVIEHLKEPHLYVQKISDCIKRGGVISLTTADVGSLIAKIQKDKWRIIHPPEHLFYFSQKTISGLLTKYGFEILDISYPGNYRNLSSLFLGNQNSIIYKRLKNNKLLNVPFYLNLFDIMYVIAKKRIECENI